MASQTEENYLKALFSMANAKGEVNISELSNFLEVSKPTVNSMIKNLSKRGLVNYEKYKPISLSALGIKEAALVLRKHRLTEMFLVEQMNFGWEEVHEIAEQVEHVQSKAFFERMDELLGFPTVDPHGSPIPDKNGLIPEQAYRPLSLHETGDKVLLKALRQSSSSLLEFLNSRELSLQTEITIVSKEAYDGSMVIQYSKHPTEALSAKVADRLLVSLVENS